MIDAELQRISPGERRGFIHRHFPGEVLLKLAGGTHAVIAQAHRQWRLLLANLVRPVAAFVEIGNSIVEPHVRTAVGNVVDRAALLRRRGHRGQTGKDGSDQAIVLHGRLVVIDLVGRDAAVFIEADVHIGVSCRRLRRPLHIVIAHPLHANRLAHFFRQQHRFVFSARVAAIRAAVVPCAGIGLYGYFVNARSQHHGKLATQRLGVLGVRMDCYRAVWAVVGQGHGGTNRSMLPVRQLIGRRQFVLRSLCAGGDVTLGLAALLHRGSLPVRFIPQAGKEIVFARQPFPITPFGCLGDLVRGLNRFPLGGSHHTHQVALDHHARVRKLRCIDRSGLNKL